MKAFAFTRYFRNFHKNFKSNFARFQPKSQNAYNYYAFFTSFAMGTLIIKYNTQMQCVDYTTSQSSNPNKSRNRLLFIKNKHAHADSEMSQLIEGLKRNGIEVVEIDLEASSDYIASLLEPKDLNFIAVNEEGDVLEIPNGDEHAKFKLMSFYKSIHEINKPDLNRFYDFVERLKENERIIYAYIPDQADYKVGPFGEYDTYNKNKIKDVRELWEKYRQLKNSHISYASSFFIIKDPKVAQALQIGQDDIGEIYTIKKSSVYNNFETNTRMSGYRVQVNRIDMTDDDLAAIKQHPEIKDDLIKRKLYENCLDHVNYFQTQNELDNIKQLLQQLGVKKVFVYYRSNNDQNFSKILTKLTKVKKDMKRDDFCVLASNNLTVLKKEFGMLHEGFTNSFRFIDYSKEWKWEPPKDYNVQFIHSDHLERREILHDSENESDKNIPDFTIPLRSIFEEKPTRKRIKNFLINALEGNPEIYFESNSRVLTYFSKNLIGKRFEEDVLKEDSNVIIEFFKPTCPSCAALSLSYEDFARIVSKIQEHLTFNEENNTSGARLENDLIHRYKIQNPAKFKNLKVFRYNIYNESPVFPSPAATPLIFLFKQDEKTKPLLIDLVDAKVNLTDNEKVIRHLIRIVDES